MTAQRFSLLMYLNVPLEVKEINPLPVAAIQGQNVPGLHSRGGRNGRLERNTLGKTIARGSERTGAADAHSPERPGRSDRV